MNALMVFLGGGLGSLLRYGFTLLIRKNPNILSLPIATLLANVSAAIIFAIVTKLFLQNDNSLWRFLLLTGFCGGLSTFSTFSFETFELFRNGQSLWAFINIILSIVLCLFPFFISAKP